MMTHCLSLLWLLCGGFVSVVGGVWLGKVLCVYQVFLFSTLSPAFYSTRTTSFPLLPPKNTVSHLFFAHSSS
jgi:uncharacterized membrane protein YccF (DUF307 family)